jgi:uncharacterized protein YeaO (DUF488 family)
LPILDTTQDRNVAVIYSAKDEIHNQAMALKAYLGRKMGTAG